MDSKECKGVITIKQISASEIPKNILGMKNMTYAEVQLDSWTARTPGALVGREGAWIGSLRTPLHSFKKLKKSDAVIRIITEDNIGGRSVIGEGTVSLYALLNLPGQYIDLKGILSLDNKYCGKFSASGAFLLEGSQALVDLEALVERSARMSSKDGNGNMNGISSNSSFKIYSEPVYQSAPALSPSSASGPTLAPLLTPTSTPTPAAAAAAAAVQGDVTAERLEKLSGMFNGVHKQNIDLQLKVGGLEEGINKKLNQVRTYLHWYRLCAFMQMIREN
jgi:hypothetical protein